MTIQMWKMNRSERNKSLNSNVLHKVLIPTWIFQQAKDNDEISRLVLECKTKLVISCAYPGNYFLFPNL
ncbi:hypothetical protein CWD94_14480 [Lysinibacillus xylanilyticus]|uniref:Uncharacterized protein n=1 Tax=Lysinibacillus xylanilyticus TaxID=582475 RepID=A0A2M9Q4S9_9BACI|nr:hypothetical protein CWD94_14480 [Lysinibacillus xylanilyticus]